MGESLGCLTFPSSENGLGLQGPVVAITSLEAGSGNPDSGRSVHVGQSGSGQTSVQWVGVVSTVIVFLFCSGNLCHYC